MKVYVKHRSLHCNLEGCKLFNLYVDGVIVGHKLGINFPYPSKKVISALKRVSGAGIPIVLCSGKALHPIKPIINMANLQNLHITDSGAIIYDPSTDKSLTFSIKEGITCKLITQFLKNNLYTEAYTEDTFFNQKNQVSSLTSQRIKIQQRNPIISESLLEYVRGKELIKIIAIAKNQQEIEKVENVVKYFKELILFGRFTRVLDH